MDRREFSQSFMAALATLSNWVANVRNGAGGTGDDSARNADSKEQTGRRAPYGELFPTNLSGLETFHLNCSCWP